jgi:hypothetical protein
MHDTSQRTVLDKCTFVDVTDFRLEVVTYRHGPPETQYGTANFHHFLISTDYKRVVNLPIVCQYRRNN